MELKIVTINLQMKCKYEKTLINGAANVQFMGVFL